MRPEAIIVHRTGGTGDELRARFQDPGSSLSAHYLVGRDGSIIQFVDDADTAFHAGVVVNGTWSGLKRKTNPNYYTIAIELEGSAGDPVPVEQYEACASLVAELAARWNFPIDADHVALHSEIRASRACPGAHFDRDELLQRALLAANANPVTPTTGEVEILKNTNLREGLPSASARIVEVLTAGRKVSVNGFTLQGEPAAGSSVWYQSEDGNFFWAGNCSVPQPRAQDEAPAFPSAPPPAEPQEPPAQDLSKTILPTIFEICATGIAEIDPLLTDPSSQPLRLDRGGRDAVGAVQDLLTGHGYKGLPSILLPSYGAYGDATLKALCDFQGLNGLTPDGMLTPPTLKQMIATPAKDPRATHAHLSLVLGIPVSGMHRILTLTAQMEGVGKFSALNLNTDGAGLSFGLIQWAQRPGRLVDILRAFEQAHPDDFVRIFGEGNSDLAHRLLAHVKKPSGGVDNKTGKATDGEFDLVAKPWPARFQEAALHLPFQRIQVNLANEAFEKSFDKMRQYDTAAVIQSERAVAFMLDVANQFGDGSVTRPSSTPDRGLAGLYRRVFRPGTPEPALLQGIADATVAAMPAKFQNGVRARRTLFLKTPLLSAQRFSP